MLIKVWSSCLMPCILIIQGFSRPVMKVSNLDTIEFIFNFIKFYSIAWCTWFLGYGIIQVVQKNVVNKKGVDLIKIPLPYLLAIQNLELI